MMSPLATTLTASATLTAFLAAAAMPCYADGEVPGGPAGSMVFQGPVQVIPATPQQAAPPSYPAPAYPQYPQGYQAPPPGMYPGYAPTPYPQLAPAPYLIPRERTPIRFESRPRYGLIVAGAVTFGSSYLMTAGITGYINAIDCGNGSHCSGTYWPLYVPVVGPFLYLGMGDKDIRTFASPVFVLSGLAQLGGLAMLIAGAVARKKVPVYAEDSGRLSVAPYLSPTNAGIQAMGRF